MTVDFYSYNRYNLKLILYYQQYFLGSIDIFFIVNKICNFLKLIIGSIKFSENFILVLKSQVFGYNSKVKIDCQILITPMYLILK